MSWCNKPIVANVSNMDGYPNIKTINSFDDENFSSRTIKAVKQCKTDYILFFLDDFFLEDFVDKQYIETAIDTINSDDNIGCIVLKDQAKNEKVCTKSYDSNFDVFGKHTPWKITTQVAIWRKDYLLKILRKGETAWDFEIIGTYRSFHYNEIILYRNEKNKNKIKYHHGGVLIRGEVFNDAIPFLVKEKINYLDWNNPLKENTKKTPYIINVLKERFGFYPNLSIYFKSIHYHGTAKRKCIKYLSNEYNPKNDF